MGRYSTAVPSVRDILSLIMTTTGCSATQDQKWDPPRKTLPSVRFLLSPPRDDKARILLEKPWVSMMRRSQRFRREDGGNVVCRGSWSTNEDHKGAMTSFEVRSRATGSVSEEYELFQGGCDPGRAALTIDRCDDCFPRAFRTPGMFRSAAGPRWRPAGNFHTSHESTYKSSSGG